LAVVAVEVGQVTPPAEHGLGVSVAAGLVDQAVQVVAHSAETAEVLLHEDARLCRRDVELLCEAEG
jgi:hypothetical protein